MAIIPTEADIKRIEVANEATAKTTTITKQIASIKDSGGNHKLYIKHGSYDSDGSDATFPAEGTDTNFSSVVLDDLAGGGNQNIGVDNTGAIVAQAISVDSVDVTYDSSSSALAVDNVQDAIDSLEANKADVSLLSSNITLFPTTASGDFTYNRMATSVDDTDYDTVAVDVGTGAITGDDQLLAGLIADAGLFTGSLPYINVPTIGNIRKTAGNSTQYSAFYFKVFRRDSGGTEHLVATSSSTGAVNPADSNYYQFNASAVVDSTWADTDRVVIKYYSTGVAGTASEYDFQFGGSSPVRTELPVPVSVVLEDPLQALGNATKDPTGLDMSQVNTVYPASVVDMSLDYNVDHWELTISPVSSSYTYYYRGVESVVTGTIVKTIPTTSKSYYVYFNSADGDASALTVTDSLTYGALDIIRDNAFVAEIVWNKARTASIKESFEFHGCNRSWAEHLYNHGTFGTRYGSGLDLTITDTQQDILLTAGTIWDEDIPHLTTELNNASGVNISTIWKDAGEWDGAQCLNGVYTVGNQPYYNDVSTPSSETLEPVPNGNFVAGFLYGTPDFGSHEIFVVTGQKLYSTRADARAGIESEYYDLEKSGLPFPEYKILYAVLIRSNGTGSAWGWEPVDSDGNMYIDYRGEKGVTGGSGSFVSAPYPLSSVLSAGNSAANTGITELPTIENGSSSMSLGTDGSVLFNSALSLTNNGTTGATLTTNGNTLELGDTTLGTNNVRIDGDDKVILVANLDDAITVDGASHKISIESTTTDFTDANLIIQPDGAGTGALVKSDNGYISVNDSAIIRPETADGSTALYLTNGANPAAGSVLSLESTGASLKSAGGNNKILIDDTDIYLSLSGTTVLNIDSGNTIVTSPSGSAYSNVNLTDNSASLQTATESITIDETLNKATISPATVDFSGANLTATNNGTSGATLTSDSGAVLDMGTDGDIQVTGSVGIGKDPVSKLDIFPNTDAGTGGIRLYGSNNDGVRLSMYTSDTDTTSAIYAWDENDGGAATYGTLKLGASVGLDQGITIDNTGAVDLSSTMVAGGSVAISGANLNTNYALSAVKDNIIGIIVGSDASLGNYIAIGAQSSDVATITAGSGGTDACSLSFRTCEAAGAETIRATISAGGTLTLTSAHSVSNSYDVVTKAYGDANYSGGGNASTNYSIGVTSNGTYLATTAKYLVGSSYYDSSLTSAFCTNSGYGARLVEAGTVNDYSYNLNGIAYGDTGGGVYETLTIKMYLNGTLKDTNSIQGTSASAPSSGVRTVGTPFTVAAGDLIDVTIEAGSATGCTIYMVNLVVRVDE